MSEVSKVHTGSLNTEQLLMSEVPKVHRELSIQSNVTHVKCYVCRSISEVLQVKITLDTSNIDSI